MVIRFARFPLFGAIEGLVKEKWPCAGMRTHIMVCVGSSIIMVSAFGFADAIKNDNMPLDPIQNWRRL